MYDLLVVIVCSWAQTLFNFSVKLLQTGFRSNAKAFNLLWQSNFFTKPCSVVHLASNTLCIGEFCVLASKAMPAPVKKLETHLPNLAAVTPVQHHCAVTQVMNLLVFGGLPPYKFKAVKNCWGRLGVALLLQKMGCWVRKL